MAAREQLEGNVRELEKTLTIERQRSKLSERWMTDRKQWNKETRDLLASIQEECNAVFSQNLAAHKSMLLSSPTSVVTSTPDDESIFSLDQPWLSKPTTSYASPLDVSHAIDETEAMVRSMMEEK